jgi:hypothetical protein
MTTGRGNSKFLNKDLPQCYFIHHKQNIDYLGTEPDSPRSGASEYSAELGHGRLPPPPPLYIRQLACSFQNMSNSFFMRLARDAPSYKRAVSSSSCNSLWCHPRNTFAPLISVLSPFTSTLQWRHISWLLILSILASPTILFSMFSFQLFPSFSWSWRNLVLFLLSKSVLVYRHFCRFLFLATHQLY